MQVPFKEMLKSIPGAVGIRLEKELPYNVVKNFGDLELRHYPAFTLARTTASGNYDSAAETCFRRLAEFIFGANTENKTTEMTTPVFIDKKGENWVMSFYLSEEYQSLKPRNNSITLETRPSKEVAVYSFTGVFTPEAMEEARTKLLGELTKNGLRAVSEVWWGMYDQPVSVPFTKRNEALVKVEWLS